MIVAPALRFSTSVANSISWRSGKMMSPSLVTTPSRSPSPSNARPSSAPVRSTVRISSARFSGLLGSGWWFGKSPSTSEYSSTTWQPSARRMPGALAPGMPLPESTTIYIGRTSRLSLVIRCVYSARMSIVAERPSPCA